MAKAREDIQYRGHRIIANAGGAMIYPQKHGMKADNVESALDQAREWIDTRYSDRMEERRDKHIGTVDDYAEALEAVAPNKGQRAMLIAHRAAPDMKMTAPQLADAAGWKSYSSANLHYGKLGQRLADDLGLDVGGSNNMSWTKAIGDYDDETSEWAMHAELAEALDRLNIG